MNLTARAFIIGALIPENAQADRGLTQEQVNAMWAELSPKHGFRQLEVAPDDSTVRFFTESRDNGLTIQPPLIQYGRIPADVDQLPVEESARDAEGMLASAAGQFGLSVHSDLGIRLVYHASVDGDDARRFVLNEVLAADDQELASLGADDGMWAGLKFVIPRENGLFTLSIEPLQADEMRTLYVNLDAQFPGETPFDAVAGRAAEIQQYVEGAVATYLQQFAGESDAPQAAAEPAAAPVEAPPAEVPAEG